MPLIHIHITRDGVTTAQKAELIAGATQLMVDVLSKDPNTTFVLLHEVDTEDWGIAGEMVKVRRARAAKSQ